LLAAEYQKEFIVNETKSVKVTLSMINNGESDWPSMACIRQVLPDPEIFPIIGHGQSYYFIQKVPTGRRTEFSFDIETQPYQGR